MFDYVIRLRHLVWGVVIVATLAAIAYYPGTWAYQRLKAAEASATYLYASIEVTDENGKKSTITRAELLDKALFRPAPAKK